METQNILETFASGKAIVDPCNDVYYAAQNAEVVVESDILNQLLTKIVQSQYLNINGKMM